jgi:uncharacterized circularly permuted ATP-grasp superfamily protein
MDAQRVGTATPACWAGGGLQPINEMFDERGQPRPGCARVVAYLLAMESRRLAALGSRAHRMFETQGVTFNVYSHKATGERIFPFDPVPRIITAEGWAELEAGLIQRARALNAFVADIYGDGQILKDGVIPRDLVIGSPQFRHAAVGIRSPGGTCVTVAGIDLVRGPDGRF